MGHSKPRVLPRALILPGARGRARAAAASEGAEPTNGCAARGANVTGPPSCSIRSGGENCVFGFFFPHPFPCLGCWSWSHTVWDMLCFSCEENYNVKRKGDRQDRAFRTGSGRWPRRLFCSPLAGRRLSAPRTLLLPLGSGETRRGSRRGRRAGPLRPARPRDTPAVRPHLPEAAGCPPIAAHGEHAEGFVLEKMGCFVFLFLGVLSFSFPVITICLTMIMI